MRKITSVPSAHRKQTNNASLEKSDVKEAFSTLTPSVFTQGDLYIQYQQDDHIQDKGISTLEFDLEMAEQGLQDIEVQLTQINS